MTDRLQRDRLRTASPARPASSRVGVLLLSIAGWSLLAATLPLVLWFWTTFGDTLRGPVSVVILGAPALLPLWVGLVCLRRAGYPVDAWLKQITR
jgi:hypothetical protein